MSYLGVICRLLLGAATGAAPAPPITHVIVVMQENRSFDHHFGMLPVRGQPEVDGIPPGFSNPGLDGRPVFAHRLASTCRLDDPPHQWDAMHAHWNGEGFVRVAARAGGDGRYAMGYYDEADLPFYYWLARAYAISDRHFSPVLGGTWHNRQFMYAATAKLAGRTGELTGGPTIFDRLDDAGVPWGVYTEDSVRQDCLGWTASHRGVHRFPAFLRELAAGTLPPVAFVNPYESDEHPPGDVQRGEAWMKRIYEAVVASPLWPKLALFFSYDEGGGFFDHVPPPAAVPPSPALPQLNRRGTRIPLVLISPWARPHSVYHRVSDHTSFLRFIELIHHLPPLTARDAEADALLGMFDFTAPPRLTPPAAPAAGIGGCRDRS